MDIVSKTLEKSLKFLEIPSIRWTLIILLVIYITGIVPLFNEQIAMIFHYSIVKLLILLFIIYIAFKDSLIALLLVIAFVLSLFMGYEYGFGFRLGPGLRGGLQAQIPGLEGDIEARISGEGFTDSQGPEGGNYNKFDDCVKPCAEGIADLKSECKGMGVWKKEFNTQGLGCPPGFSGQRIGSPY